MMRPRTYSILDRAVEEGTKLGYNRAHKHTSKPTEALMLERIQDAVMEKICEVFEFDFEYPKNDVETL